MRGVLALGIALWLVAGSAWSATLAEQIDALLADSSLQHGIQGVVVASAKTGRTLYEHNADLALMPASCMKLLVSAAALDRLGPDFTYKTEVLEAGEISSKGVLAGDLILKGGGDPVLETANLAELARALKGQGLVKVTGDLVVDDTLFDDQRLGWAWSWDDLPYYYSAEISALNLNRNVVGVYVYPGARAGSSAPVRTDPPTDYLTIASTAKTGEASSKKSVSCYRQLGKNVVNVEGSIPQGYRVTGCEEAITVEEPALYAGEILKDELGRQGILVLGQVRAAGTPSNARLLASHTSPPLSRILALLNKPSDNLVAEVLLKTLGAFLRGKGTTEAGAEVEKEFLGSVGADLGALSIVDGSGLSRLNLISPRNLVKLLAYMYGHKNAALYVDSLPVAGVDGTLRNRMKGTLAEKNVKAKSGYVSRVSTLSGYVTTRSGEPLVFSILMNHHLCGNVPAMQVQNRICEALAEMP